MPQNPIDANPSTSLIHLTAGSSSFCYAWMAVMGVSALALAFLTKKRPRGTRAFHHLGLAVLVTATISYYAMGSNLGKAPVQTTQRRFGTRAIWYARYIDWFITTPLLLLMILLGTGLPTSDILIILFFDEVMIVCGLMGAFTESNYKWGFFVFGLISLLYILYHLFSPARLSARMLGAGWGSTYTKSIAVLGAVWFMYPIAWALQEGSNVYGTSGEMIFYGVLDFLSKPVFIFLHLLAVSKLDYSTLLLSSGKFSDPINGNYNHTHGFNGYGHSNGYYDPSHPNYGHHSAGVGTATATGAAAGTGAAGLTHRGDATVPGLLHGRRKDEVPTHGMTAPGVGTNYTNKESVHPVDYTAHGAGNSGIGRDTKVTTKKGLFGRRKEVPSNTTRGEVAGAVGTGVGEGVEAGVHHTGHHNNVDLNTPVHTHGVGHTGHGDGGVLSQTTTAHTHADGSAGNTV